MIHLFLPTYNSLENVHSLNNRKQTFNAYGTKLMKVPYFNFNLVFLNMKSFNCNTIVFIKKVLKLHGHLIQFFI